MALLALRRFVSQFLYQIILLGLTSLLILSIPFLIFFYIPYIFFRALVSLYAWIFRPDLLSILPPLSSLWAQDCTNYRPKANYIVWILLKGELELDKFKKELTTRVLNLKKSFKQKEESKPQNNNESEVKLDGFGPPQGESCFPQLRQFFKKSKGFIFWGLDQNFCIENHVKTAKDFGLIDTAICEENVLKLCERLLSKSWPEKQSPWQFIWVPNINQYETYQTLGQVKQEEGKTLLIFHFHTALGDPYSFLKLIFNRLGGPSPPDPVLIEEETPKRDYFGNGSFSELLSSILTILRLPYAYCAQFLGGFDMNQWQVEGKAYTRLFRVAKIKRVPLDSLQTIRNVHRVSLSSVILAALAGGIRRQLRENGMETPSKMQVYIPIPYQGHPNDSLVNHMSGCLVRLPLEVGTPRERLLVCNKSLESVRETVVPQVNYWIPKCIGMMPWAFKDWGKNWVATGQWANFQGPPRSISIMGHEVEEFSMNSGTMHSSTAFTINTLSYCGYLNIDLCIDRSIAPTETDTLNLIEKIREELNALWEEDAI